jgi:predicted Zn-dependent protease
VLPQEYPLVVYFRGYCKLKLGQDPAPDFRTASALSTLYVFPHREIYFRIFQAALQQNSADPVAHALAGDLYFDSMRISEAIDEWTKALSLKRDLPALHRNLGLALLEFGDKKAVANAGPILTEARRLNPNDPEIAEDLNRLNAPVVRGGPIEVAQGDVAGRALVTSPINPEAAAALFSPANFPKEKQPDAVRRAYIEVQFQRLVARARAGKCAEAMPGLEALGDEDRNLPFTLYGFGSFMKAPHFQYYMGVLASACGDEKAAKKFWGKIAKNNEPIESVDYIFPYLAANDLGESGAQARIGAALQALQKTAPDDSRPVLTFAQGALLKAAGKSAEGEALLQKSLHSSDSFVQYMSLEALVQASRK